MNTNYPLDRISLMIVDSGSSDDTTAIAQRTLQGANSGIRWTITNLERLGKSVAVNYILKNLETDYLLMLDADAVCDANSFNLLLDWFSDPEIGAVCGQFSSKYVDDDYEYRTRFNTLRVGESVVDSTAIFEGSICCFRVKSLCGQLINENINADDSQLAMIVRSNGYRAVMDPRIRFSETNSNVSKSRRLRRGQGLVRSLLHYSPSVLGKGKYSIIFANTFYFYVIFPWLFTTSSLISLYLILQLSYDYDIRFFLITFAILSLTIWLSRTLRTLYGGCLTLIKAHLNLILGVTHEIWEPDRNS